MPFRSSRSWFWPGLLAVVLAFTGLGVAVERIADRADDPRAVPAGIPEPAILDPEPMPVQPAPSPLGKARRVYRDRFAGFAFTIPKTWVEFRFFNYSVAPDQSSMLVYQYNGGGPQRDRYSLTLLVSQVESAKRTARDARANARASESTGAARSTTIAGRPAQIVTERPRNCEGCVKQHVSVQWDDRTSITFVVYAGGEDPLMRYRRATWKMIRSLRHSPRDPSADEIEAFLDARVAGRGARPWLTRKAWKHFDV